MLKLKQLTKADREKHYKLLKARFDKELPKAVALISQGSYDAMLIKHLTDSLRTILLGTPVEIEAFADDVVRRFAPFSIYAARHTKGTDPADDTHMNTLAIVHACFNYRWFSDQTKGWGAYQLVESYNLRICPYCQASHVNFHLEKVKGQTGIREFKMRPPLDHYLPKSIYPYLAVSLSNLVPSCAQCNSGVKTASDPLGKGFAHPIGVTAIKVLFSTKGTIRKNLNGWIKADEVVVTITGQDAVSISHVDEFRLKERYLWYRHEIKDLINRNDQHRDLNRKLKGVVPREFYVLGFLETQAEERSLGLCLRDVYNELAP